MKLTDFKVLTFDCYGTLIDWESGMVEALKPLTSQVSPPLSRDAILEAHARCESTQQALTPAMRYTDLLAVVHKRLAEAWGVHVSWEACVAYGRSVPNWPAFADSTQALRTLGRHFQLVVLSNVDNASFAGSQAQLGAQFDGVYTAEDIGSYKPDPRNFSAMLEGLAARGFRKPEILHVAESMFHDHGPANRCGLASCWIYRRHDQQGFGATMDPGEMPRYDFRFDSMAALAAGLEAER